MADDLAFLFDDPVRPRPGKRTLRPQPHTAAELPDAIRWMTLREAHDQTSIPVSTLRKWAKRGKVRARLVRQEDRELRLVAFDDVVERARALERKIHPSQVVIDLRHPERVEAILETREMAEAARAEAETPAGAVDELEEADPAVATESVTTERGVGAEAGTAPRPERPADEPEGSILVPIDAWDRLLGQLGNLHEAGQQLAAARERAAKAETEAEFLRERLRDMRKRAETAELAIELQRHDRELPTAPETPEPVLQIGWRRLRQRLFGS